MNINLRLQNKKTKEVEDLAYAYLHNTDLDLLVQFLNRQIVPNKGFTLILEIENSKYYFHTPNEFFSFILGMESMFNLFSGEIK